MEDVLEFLGSLEFVWSGGFLIVGVRFKASFDIEFLSFLIRICFKFSHVCVQVDAFRVQ